MTHAPVRPSDDNQPEAIKRLFGRDVQEDEDKAWDFAHVDELQEAEGMEPDVEASRNQRGEVSESPEAHQARVKPGPTRPSSEEVAKHDATHCPYRNWCPVCIAASAREDPHPDGADVMRRLACRC